MCYKRGGVTCPCYAVQGDHRFYHAVVDGHRCQSVTPSDLATVFTALDALVRLRSRTGSRDVPIRDFYTGPGETVLAKGEFVERLLVPAWPGAGKHYEKLNRSSGDFAVVSVAAVLRTTQAGQVKDARVVLGAIAPTPFRARETERAIVVDGLADLPTAAALWTHHAHPLAANGWKVDAAVGMIERTIGRAYAAGLSSGDTSAHEPGSGGTS
jgi:CO/xanthine dehydrogenase FAD-binding subunit